MTDSYDPSKDDAVITGDRDRALTEPELERDDACLNLGDSLAP